VRLEQRIAELQTQLRKLSEAPAAKLNKGGKRGIPDSTPPPGSQPDRKGNPDPDDSLLHYFLWKLDRASTATARKAVVAEVEIRLTRRLKRPQDAEVVAGSTSSIIAVHDRIEERDRRIAEEYEGLEPGSKLAGGRARGLRSLLVPRCSTWEVPHSSNGGSNRRTGQPLVLNSPSRKAA
jgi:hypothetical protein